MPKIIFLTFLFALFLISCEKQSFKVKDYKISKLTDEEFANSILPKVYFDMHYKSKYRSKIQSLREMKASDRFSAYAKARYNGNKVDSDKISRTIENKEKEGGYEKERELSKRYDKISRQLHNEEQNQKLNEIKDSIKHNGIKTYMSLQNNTNEVIEDLYITNIITFKFNNKTINYKRSVKANVENIDPGKHIDIELYDVIPLAKGNSEVLNIHKPNSVRLRIYLNAHNSVGFNNANNSIITLNDSHESRLGSVIDKDLTKKALNHYGELIIDEDILKLWNEIIQD